MRFLGSLVLALVLFTAAVPAAPTTGGDGWKDCEQREDADRRIAGCTRVLADSTETAANRSIAFNNRGNARGVKGEFERAIADYTEAIRLDPESVWPASNRGRAYLFSGDVAKARADFQQARNLDPASVYLALWLDIAERRAGLPGRLKQTTAEMALSKWPGPIVRMYLGQATPAQALTAAGADAQKRAEQVCEVNFYAGELALARGKRNEALRLFVMAAGECPRGLIETTSAEAELRALGAPQ